MNKEGSARMRWLALLSGRIPLDFTASGGVHTPQDVLKAVMAGANIAMMASALLAHGPAYAAGVLAGLRDWMVEHEYESIRQMHGSMRQGAVADPAALERGNYTQVLGSFDTHRCFAPLQRGLQPHPGHARPNKRSRS